MYLIVSFISDNVLCCYYKLFGHNAKKEHITERAFSKDLYVSISAYHTKENQVTKVKKSRLIPSHVSPPSTARKVTLQDSHRKVFTEICIFCKIK